MPTLLITHPACLDHLTPSGHPERPDRLRAIDRALEHERFQMLARAEAPAATLEAIALCHPMELRHGDPRCDAEAGPGAARRRHLDVVGELRGGAARGRRRRARGRRGDRQEGRRTRSSPRARPATTPRPRGRWASACSTTWRSPPAMPRSSTALERVAIVDFDVHHGNGSQEIFWSDPTVMYCSTHEMPLYPGTGAADERGEHDNIVNAPLRAGDGGERVPRRVRELDPAAAHGIPARPDRHLGRFRRPHARPARQSAAGGG